MKRILMLAMTVVLLQGCTSSKPAPSEQAVPGAPTTTTQPQTPENTSKPVEPAAPQPDQTSQAPATYANDMFHDVTVAKIKEDTYEVKGSAQVFEAVGNYVVEDGHNELAKGSFKTSAGAPTWGDFTFTVKVKKADSNTTLTLVLFEVSPKDGSRRSELPIPLPE